MTKTRDTTNHINHMRAAHMRAALGLARRGLGNVWPNPAVGCVLVREDLQGRVVGRGWTQPQGRPHAETEALVRAGDEARGATAYVTLEPCDHHGQTPPCSEALAAAGISRAVIALRDPDPRVSGKGIERLKAAGIEVVEGVLEDEARQLNLGFILKTTQQRPLFTLKMATDREGRIPPPGAANKWITGAAARRRGHLLRAQHDAVLFGIGTVLDDDPLYTCRLPGMEGMSPVRVLLDTQMRLPAGSQLMKTLDKAPLWVITGDGEDASKLPKHKNLEVITAEDVDQDGRPAPQWVACELARRGLTRILIESGPKVASAFHSTGLIDRISWFRAPESIGGNGIGFLTDASDFVKTSVLETGSDVLETYSKD